jgi:hypothetical protein
VTCNKLCPNWPSYPMTICFIQLSIILRSHVRPTSWWKKWQASPNGEQRCRSSRHTCNLWVCSTRKSSQVTLPPYISTLLKLHHNGLNLDVPNLILAIRTRTIYFLCNWKWRSLLLLPGQTNSLLVVQSFLLEPATAALAKGASWLMKQTWALSSHPATSTNVKAASECCMVVLAHPEKSMGS